MLSWRLGTAADLQWVLPISRQTALDQLSSRERNIGSRSGVAKCVASMYQRVLQPGTGVLLIATAADGVPVGYLLVGVEVPQGRAQPAATLLDVWVAPVWRGHGVASLLQRLALPLAIRAGAADLRSMVALHNTDSLQSGLRNGLQPAQYLVGKRL